MNRLITLPLDFQILVKPTDFSGSSEPSEKWVSGGERDLEIEFMIDSYSKFVIKLKWCAWKEWMDCFNTYHQILLSHHCQIFDLDSRSYGCFLIGLWDYILFKNRLHPMSWWWALVNRDDLDDIDRYEQLEVLPKCQFQLTSRFLELIDAYIHSYNKKKERKKENIWCQLVTSVHQHILAPSPLPCSKTHFILLYFLSKI